MALPSYDIYQEIRTPETYTAYDRSFSASDCRGLAVNVYATANELSEKLHEDFLILKEKIEEILELMDNAIIINGEVFLKNKLIVLYDDLNRIINEIDNKIVTCAIEPSIRYCDFQQITANSQASREADAYRNQVDAQNRSQGQTDFSNNGG